MCDANLKAMADESDKKHCSAAEISSYIEKRK
jgi:hypothetical protein